jgi:subtilisin family serine protease
MQQGLAGQWGVMVSRHVPRRRYRKRFRQPSISHSTRRLPSGSVEPSAARHGLRRHECRARRHIDDGSYFPKTLLMSPLDLVNLTALMGRAGGGRREIMVGLIDGPVAIDHPDLVAENIRDISRSDSGACAQADSFACMHGTFVAGILCARSGSPAPGICPNCTLLVHPIFAEADSNRGDVPSATPEQLAAAIVKTIDAGARVLNLSSALSTPSSRGERRLEEALDQALVRGVIVVAAAGNQGALGSSAITRHPWVISVAACDLNGRPIYYSNLGSSIGRRGLTAPGDGITSLGTDGKPRSFGGTSAAAPFVTGAIALLYSEFPAASARQIKLAVTRAGAPRRTVVPPLLDAWAAYQALAAPR